MGNNSSVPKRRRSVIRDNKPHVVHREYTSGTSNGLGPMKLKSGPVVNGEHATVYGDRHMSGRSTISEASTATTDPTTKDTHGIDEGTLSSGKPKVTTPSILLDGLVDGGDGEYFSKHPDALDVTTSNGYGDDDDGYGIDEDLVSPVDNEANQMSKVKLKFTQEGLKVQDYVYVIGSFDHWARKVMLDPDYDESGNLFFKTVLSLPLGVYRVKFLVNGYTRYTNDLPTATDKSGNFVNWFEVTENIDSTGNEEVEAGELERYKINNNMRKSTPSILSQDPQQQHHQQHPPLQSPGYSRSSTPLLQEPTKPKFEYSQEIPKIFETPSDPEELLPAIDEEFIHKHPMPELPVYLNNNYLNKHFTTHHTLSSDTANLAKTNLMQGLNSHIIPHVNLKHLLTSNIKNGVLGVACTTRYSGKFVTQIMYSPSTSGELE